MTHSWIIVCAAGPLFPQLSSNRVVKLEINGLHTQMDIDIGGNKMKVMFTCDMMSRALRPSFAVIVRLSWTHNMRGCGRWEQTALTTSSRVLAPKKYQNTSPKILVSRRSSPPPPGFVARSRLMSVVVIAVTAKPMPGKPPGQLGNAVNMVAMELPSGGFLGGIKSWFVRHSCVCTYMLVWLMSSSTSVGYSEDYRLLHHAQL